MAVSLDRLPDVSLERGVVSLPAPIICCALEFCDAETIGKVKRVSKGWLAIATFYVDTFRDLAALSYPCIASFPSSEIYAISYHVFRRNDSVSNKRLHISQAIDLKESGQGQEPDHAITDTLHQLTKRDELVNLLGMVPQLVRMHAFAQLNPLLKKYRYCESEYQFREDLFTAIQSQAPFEILSFLLRLQHWDIGDLVHAIILSKQTAQIHHDREALMLLLLNELSCFKREEYQDEGLRITLQNGLSEALKYAATYNSITIVRLIEDSWGIDDKLRVETIRTAADHFQAPIISILLSGKEFSVEERGKLLIYAAKQIIYDGSSKRVVQNATDVIDAFLKSGEIGAQDKDIAIVWSAAYQANPDVLHLLLQNRKMVNRDARELTISNAVTWCSLEVLEIIIYSIEDGDTSINTSCLGRAVYGAAKLGHVEKIRLLLRYGALSVEDRGKAIHAATIAKEQAFETISFLIQDGEIRREELEKAKQLAEKKERHDLVELLSTCRVIQK